MAVPDPTKLDVNEVLTLLFPDGEVETRVLPRRWESWTAPQRKLPIDDEVGKLITNSRRKKIRIRPREDLNKDGVRCPFYHARYMTAIATIEANMKIHETNIFHNKNKPRLQRISESSEDIKEKINLFLREFCPFDLLPHLGVAQKSDPESWNKTAGIINAAFAALENAERELAKIRDLSRAEIKRAKRVDYDVWDATFIAQIQKTWRRLTDHTPSSQSLPFMDFLYQAYACVGTREPAWEKKVRTVVELINARPDWDSWHQSDPPGTTYMTEDEYKAFLQRRLGSHR